MTIVAVLAAGTTTSAQEGPCCLKTPFVSVLGVRYVSLQQAVDAAPDGSTLVLESGTFRENVIIEAKRLRFVGTGAQEDRGTSIDATAVDKAVLSLRRGAEVDVHRIAIFGGAAGVASEDDQAPSKARLLDVSLSAMERAVAGRFASLELRNSAIFATLRHGISVTAAELLLHRVIVHDVGGVGIVVFNLASGGSILIDGVESNQNANGGLVVVGSGSPVEVRNSNFLGNGQVGVAIYDAQQVTLRSVQMNQTQAQSEGSLGDGLAVRRSSVDVVDAIMFANARAGISVWGGLATLERTTFWDNPIQINTESIDGVRGGVENLGGIACLRGDPPEEEPCHALSSELLPPAPPER